MKQNLIMAGCLCLAFGLVHGTAQASLVVNIGGTVSGFSPGTPGGTHVPGDPAVPVGVINQLTLGAGTYTISNAAGMVGANPSFRGWRFDGGNNWVWNYVIADSVTNKVLLFGFAGTENGSGVWSSQSLVAAQSSVQNYSTTLVLASTTTINFGVRDYYLPDNAGGVALNIEAVPIPAAGWMFGSVLAGLAGLAWRRRVSP